MNNENNQQTDRKEGVTVSSIVPAGWKLWALLFRAIAEGHLDELEQDINQPVLDYLGEEWSLEASFSDAVRGLYVETCNDTRRELPVEIYDLESPKKALSELKNVANDILYWYEKAHPFIAGDTDEDRMFARVADNCRIAVQLLDSKPDRKRSFLKSLSFYADFFTSSEKEQWFEIVNGKCIEQMEYDDFRHALECDNDFKWYEFTGNDDEYVFHEEVYWNIKISPINGYGMTFFGFLLLLLTMRYRNARPKDNSFIDENDEFYPKSIDDSDAVTLWADRFQNRIDWGENYYLREDSWKEAYLCSDENPSSIASGISREEMDFLQTLCGRPTFESAVSAGALEQVIAGSLSKEPGFSHYRFLYENREELGKLYPLLVQELEYFYQNFDDIVECFYDENDAEAQKEYSKWRYESRRSNGQAIEDIYAGVKDADVDNLHRLFFERSQFAYEYLWQQPLLHSGMIKRYLQDCIVQDENLLTVIKRKLDDTPIQQAIDKEMARKSAKQERVLRAKAELRANGIIDEHDSIRKTGNYSKTIDLVRVLISKREDDKKEFARPVRGWKPFIEEEKLKSIPQSDLDENNERVILIDSDNRFTDTFYGTLAKKGNNYARSFLNGIDWSLYDDVFTLDGKLLKGEDLKKAIGSRKDLYLDIIKDIIRKYEMMDNNSFARITRKK